MNSLLESAQKSYVQRTHELEECTQTKDAADRKYLILIKTRYESRNEEDKERADIELSQESANYFKILMSYERAKKNYENARRILSKMTHIYDDTQF